MNCTICTMHATLESFGKPFSEGNPFIHFIDERLSGVNGQRAYYRMPVDNAFQLVLLNNQNLLIEDSTKEFSWITSYLCEANVAEKVISIKTVRTCGQSVDLTIEYVPLREGAKMVLNPHYSCTSDESMYIVQDVQGNELSVANCSSSQTTVDVFIHGLGEHSGEVLAHGMIMSLAATLEPLDPAFYSCNCGSLLGIELSHSAKGSIVTDDNGGRQLKKKLEELLIAGGLATKLKMLKFINKIGPDVVRLRADFEPMPEGKTALFGPRGYVISDKPI